MNDTIKATIETLRRLGYTVEADEVQALLANRMQTVRAYEAATNSAYRHGWDECMKLWRSNDERRP